MADTFPNCSLTCCCRTSAGGKEKKKSVISLLTPQTWLLETKKAVVRKLSFVEVKLGSEFESIMVLCDAVLKRKE